MLEKFTHTYISCYMFLLFFLFIASELPWNTKKISLFLPARRRSHRCVAFRNRTKRSPRNSSRVLRRLTAVWLMDQPCAWSTLTERMSDQLNSSPSDWLTDWLRGMFFNSIPVQPCSSQIWWCRQTGRGREPANVRQTFKYRFVPKLILIDGFHSDVIKL